VTILKEKKLTSEEKKEAVESSEEIKVEADVEAEAETEEKEVEVEAGEKEEAEIETAEEAGTEEAKVETPTTPVTIKWCPPVPEEVFIAGTFNDWNPTSHQMTRSEMGEWEATLDLAPGTYEYRFVVDGEWITDPTCEDKIENPHGTHNTVLTVE
jgi:5'-AMP-activated protein kinase regulatory beta subunit